MPIEYNTMAFQMKEFKNNKNTVWLSKEAELCHWDVNVM
jgi:hypothetical protein